MITSRENNFPNTYVSSEIITLFVNPVSMAYHKH